MSATTAKASTKKTVQFDETIDWTEESRRSELRRQKSILKKEAKTKMANEARRMHTLLMNPSAASAIVRHAMDIRAPFFGGMLVRIFTELGIQAYDSRFAFSEDNLMSALAECRQRHPNFSELPERSHGLLSGAYRALLDEGAVEDDGSLRVPVVTPTNSPPRDGATGN